MGIKGLKKLLEMTCKNGIYTYSSVSEFSQKEKERLYSKSIDEHIYNPIKKLQLKNYYQHKPLVVGIDLSLYAIRYKRVFKKIEYGFLKQILSSLSSGIFPIYVFDGKAPIEKSKVIIQRKNKNQKNLRKINDIMEHHNIININLDIFINRIKLLNQQLLADDTQLYQNNYLLDNGIDDDEIKKLIKKSIFLEQKDFIDLQKFFDFLHIPYIISTTEADDLLATLYNNKIIDACLSDDMDMLPKGCNNLIQITNNGVKQFLLDEILIDLKINYHQFIDLCILLGSDYYDIYTPKLKSHDLFALFKEFPSLEEFVDEYCQTDPKIKDHLNNYVNCRSFFTLKTFPYLKTDYTYSPIIYDNIISYFNKIGINFDDNTKKKFQFMIKKINKYIGSLTKYV